MFFVCLLIGWLVFFLRECLEDAVKLGGAGLKSGYNVLGGRLQQGHNVGDKFVLALDGCQDFNLVGSQVCCLLDVSALEQRQRIALLDERLEQLCRSVAYIFILL